MPTLFGGVPWPPGLISVAMNPYGFPSYSDFVNMSAKKVKSEKSIGKSGSL